MIINGKEIAQKIKDEVKGEVAEIIAAGKPAPKLVVIIVGDNQASKTYVKNKEKACEYTGIISEVIRYSTITEAELLEKIKQLNQDSSVSGILVQLPLPKNISEEKVIMAISPEKDVDGFHPDNLAKLVLGQDTIAPCTAQGIIELIESETSLEGKNVVMIGRSNIVGKPTSFLCLHKNATVIMCHSKTRDLKKFCKEADIIISAIGKPKFLTMDYFSEKSIVIDVGINRDENGKLCGDVDFDNVVNNVKAITPVPGGVGPMTVAMLMKNTLKAYKLQK